MTFGAMQPYFLPYLGYWQLINLADSWVVFDEADYHKRSWMNRNRILHPEAEIEFQFFTVPIEKHPRGTKIREIKIKEDPGWRKSITGQLTLYKRMRAPYYSHVTSLLDTILNNSETNFSLFCVHAMQQVCTYLDIPFNYQFSSKLKYNRDAVHGPGDWALQMAIALNATTYINPIGGVSIFCENDFEKNGIKLRFLDSNLSAYQQGRRERFTPGLSIIDVLMFNSVQDVRAQLEAGYKLLTQKEAEDRDSNG